MRLPLLPLALLAAAAPGCGLHGARLALVEENDVMNLGHGLDTDRDYTQGGVAALTLSAEDTPGWARDAAAAIPLFAGEDEIHLALVLGQEMFTPEDLATRTAVPDDRPYAGWLWAGLALQGRRLDADGDRRRDRQDTLELDLGVLGPASLAEPSQNITHRLLAIPEANGWDHGLPNEPGLQATWDRRWRALRLGLGGAAAAEAIPLLRARAGTIHVDGAAGGLARVGWNLPRDFGPMAVDGAGIDKGAERPKPWGYFFAGAEGRGVVHDAVLEGGTFGDGPSVRATSFVHDATLGIAAGFGNLSASFSQTWRSPEFRERRRHHRFGTLLVSWAWGF